MKIFLKKLLHFRFGYAIINKLFGAKQYAPLAQLDRASGYGPEGRGFESLTAYHPESIDFQWVRDFYFGLEFNRIRPFSNTFLTAPL